MKVSRRPSPPPVCRASEPKKGDHGLPDRIQAGHDLTILGEHWRPQPGLSKLMAGPLAVLGEHTHLLHSGAAGLNLMVAGAAGFQAAQQLREGPALEKAEGLNHLVIATGCGLTAAHLAGGTASLGALGGRLLLLHGLGEVAIGLHRCRSGHTQLGLLQAGHGGCLAAAELYPGAALPLCLAMIGLTAAQTQAHGN